MANITPGKEPVDALNVTEDDVVEVVATHSTMSHNPRSDGWLVPARRVPQDRQIAYDSLRQPPLGTRPVRKPQQAPVPISLDRDVNTGLPLSEKKNHDVASARKKIPSGSFKPINTMHRTASGQAPNKRQRFTTHNHGLFLTDSHDQREQEKKQNQGYGWHSGPDAIDDSDVLSSGPFDRRTIVIIQPQKTTSRELSPEEITDDEVGKNATERQGKKRPSDETVDSYGNRPPTKLPRIEREERRQMVKTRNQRDQRTANENTVRITSHHFAGEKRINGHTSNFSTHTSPIREVAGMNTFSGRPSSKDGANNVRHDSTIQTLRKIPVQIAKAAPESDPIEIEDSPEKATTAKLLPTQERTSPGMKLLRKHQKTWNLFSCMSLDLFYQNPEKIEVVLDTLVKRIQFRVNDQLKSQTYKIADLYKIVHSDKCTRLQFRGRPPEIVCLEFTTSCIEFLQTLENLHGVDDVRFVNEDRMATLLHKDLQQRDVFIESRATREALNNPNLGEMGTEKDLHALEFLKARSNGDSLGMASLTQTNTEVGNRKRKKRSSELRDEHGNPSTFPTSKSMVYSRPPTRGTVPVTRRMSLEHQRRDPQNFEASNEEVDQFEVPEADGSATPRFDRPQQANKFTREARSQGEISAPATRLQPPRSTRATRSYVELDPPEPPEAVERFSVKHGLGPRWKESLTYPKTGKKRVTVDFDDLERLDEDQFLNDNLMEFAFRWIRERTQDPEGIYWFSTYFYETLTSGKGSKINYDKVKRWTKDVDLFSYKYVIVPVNENFHWYLIIICNLPALKGPSEQPKTPPEIDQVEEEPFNAEPNKHDDVELSILTSKMDFNSPKTASEDVFSIDQGVNRTQVALGNERALRRAKVTPKARPKVRDPSLPTIITMDSLGQTHSSSVSAIKQYLVAEAQERYGLSWENGDLQGFTAKGMPTQNNLSDCGVYVIGYVASLLDNRHVFVKKILQKELDEKRDFRNLRATHLRKELRDVILEAYYSQIGESLPKSVQTLLDVPASKEQERNEIAPSDTLTPAAKQESTAPSEDVAVGDNAEEVPFNGFSDDDTNNEPRAYDVTEAAEIKEQYILPPKRSPKPSSHSHTIPLHTYRESSPQWKIDSEVRETPPASPKHDENSQNLSEPKAQAVPHPSTGWFRLPQLFSQS